MLAYISSDQQGTQKKAMQLGTTDTISKTVAFKNVQIFIEGATYRFLHSPEMKGYSRWIPRAGCVVP
jgi:hypothetical protein